MTKKIKLINSDDRFLNGEARFRSEELLVEDKIHTLFMVHITNEDYDENQGMHL